MLAPTLIMKICASFSITLAFLLVFALPASTDDEETKDGWISLFNGKDLSGWTPKIAGYPAGENALDTFRVEDGILKVSYDKYDKFDNRFGHLYSNVAYSHYLLRMEYLFTGTMMKDAPTWVNLNSGVMLHSQSPLSMRLDQHFPVSMEFQFLADDGTDERSTGNVCTPGTNLEIDGELVTQHIVRSTAPVFPVEKWVKIEAEVRGDEVIVHRVDGKEVLRYQKPQLDPEGRVQENELLLKAGAPKALKFGYIALQAEGQPVWFRNIELKPLAEK